MTSGHPLADRRITARRLLQAVRWSVAWCLAVIFFVAATGLPLSTRPVVRDDAPFPCMDCPCGCSSAEYCWRSCCCHTDREKIAWAEEHGVQPPDFLVKRVAADRVPLRSAAGGSCGDGCAPARQACGDHASDLDVTRITIERRTVTCCVGGRRVVCEVEIPVRTGGVATAGESLAVDRPQCPPAGCCDRGEAANNSSTQSGRNQIVTVQAALTCKGMSTVWTVIASGVITRITPALPVDPIVVDQLCVQNLCCTTRTLAPDPPVPICPAA